MFLFGKKRSEFVQKISPLQNKNFFIKK